MSSYQPSVFTKSLLAAVDLSAKQYRYVANNGSDKYNVAGGVTGAIGAGFLMNDPLADAPCRVATIGGGALGVCSATISGSELELKADANGELLPAVAGDVVVAISLESAAVGDVLQIIPVYSYKMAAGISLVAGADLSSSQGLYVGDDGSGDVDIVGGATGAIGYGFLANAPILAGVPIIHGPGQPTAAAISGAAIASAGLELMSNALGKLITATTTGDVVVAIGTASAAGADEALTVIPVLYPKA